MTRHRQSRFFTPGVGQLKRGIAHLHSGWWLLPSIAFHLVLVAGLAWICVGGEKVRDKTYSVLIDPRKVDLGTNSRERDMSMENIQEDEAPPEMVEEVPEIVDTEEELTEDDILDEVPTENVTDSPFDKDQFNEVIGIGGGAGGHRMFGGRFGRNRIAKGRAAARRGAVAGMPTVTRTWKRSANRPHFARVYIGGGNSLELVKMRVTVMVDGPRARTVVDHIFKNPHGQQLEGTFQYPLPSGASPCYYGMFLSNRFTGTPKFFGGKVLADIPPAVLATMAPGTVLRRIDEGRWGELREARVVKRSKARRVYEEITRRKIDPALLEYSGPNVFKGRVFPIPARGYSRVILAYEEHLPLVGTDQLYRFPLPDCPLESLDGVVSVPLAGFKDAAVTGLGGVHRHAAENRMTFTFHQEGQGSGGELQLRCTPIMPDLQVIAGKEQGLLRRAFYARFRPTLKGTATRTGSDRAVFLLDTSYSEHPDRFNTSLAILRKILEKDPAIRRFNVICFDTQAVALAPKGWLTNDAAGRKSALDRLNKVLLEGATDLGAAFARLATLPGLVEKGKGLDLFLLSDGKVTWGSTRPQRLLDSLRERTPLRLFCYRTGQSAENLELFKRLTRGGGSVFNVFTPAQVAAAAAAHRRPGCRITGVKVRTAAGPVSDLLVQGMDGTLYPGGELVIAGRCTDIRKAELEVTGVYEGQDVAWVEPLRLGGESELAARAWAEILVKRLLALDRPELETLAAAYAQVYNLASRVTSMLVLERDSDYKRFGVEEESTRLSVGDLARHLAEWEARSGAPRTARERLRAVLESRFAGTQLLVGKGRERLEKLLRLLAPESGPTPAATASLILKGSVPPGYLAHRKPGRRAAPIFLAEADRRHRAGLPAAAVRCLSTVVENNAGRSDTLRLAAYRLLAMKRARAATGLFERVLEQRPFEPHSWRDLALVAAAQERYAYAALLYEVVLGHSWHRRFRTSMQLVARSEYGRMMRRALTGGKLAGGLKAYFGSRLEFLAKDRVEADLLVAATWNTDNTDVDLWIQEPDGQRCGYSKRKTTNGGVLHEDLTRGYGPEQYAIAKAPAGTYTVLLHYFNTNPNQLAGETHVMVDIITDAGRPTEKHTRHQVVLTRKKQWVVVAQVQVE